MPSSETKRLLIVIAIAAAVATAGILYFALVHAPGEDRAETERQIYGWEAAWTGARDCLLGDKPMAADVGDAMVARELAIGTTEDAMGDCTKLVGMLVRPEGPEAIAAVEKVWPTVEEAGRKVALAYLEHRERPLAPTTLPDALSALGNAHVALRKAAGMKPPESRSGAVFATLRPTPLTLDGKPVTALVGDTIAGVGFHGIARAGSETYDAIGKPDGTLTGVVAVEGDVVSRPTRAWRAGIDSMADDAAALRLAPGDRPIATGGPGLQVIGVLGEAAERVIAFGESGQLVRLARSTDSGATWKVIDVPTAGVASHAVDYLGNHIDLVWSTGTAVRWMRLTAANATGSLPAPQPLPGDPARLDNTCLAGNAFWILGGYPPPTPPRLIRIADEAVGKSLDEIGGRGGTITACSTSHVLITPVDGPLLECDTGACQPVELPGLAKIAVVDGVIAVKQRSQLVGIWRGRGAPTFVKLDPAWEVEHVVDLGGGPVIVVRDLTANTLATAKLP